MNTKHQTINVVDVRKMLGVGDGSLKAQVDIRYGDIVIKGFGVLEGKSGLFVSMPRKAAKDGRWYDMIVLPDKLKDEFEQAILSAYEKEANCAS